MSRVSVYPRDFDRCVELITRKIEQIAMKFGASDDDCADLQCSLEALSPFARSRVAAMLTGIQLQAGDDSPVMAFAARYVLNLAREVWESSPAGIGPMAATLNESSGAVE